MNHVTVNTGSTAQRLDRVATDLDKLDDELREGANIVKRDAERRAPKRTGKLANDIDVRRTARGKQEVSLGRLAYGPPIHHGHRRRNITAQPYLFDAARAKKRTVIERVRSEVADIIRRFNRSA